MMRPLCFATFLAPNLYPLYAYLACHIGRRLGVPTELFVGTAYRQMLTRADVGFLCGLAYVELNAGPARPLEALAAPVLRGERYGGRPVYYSEVIVRRDSPFRTFADLRGRSWSYNEPWSHSGYGITRYHLVRLGETRGFFAAVVDAGFHERSLDLVCSGTVDASAIDSQVFAVALRDRPGLSDRLRVVESLGPSPIQPLAAARRLPQSLKEDIRASLVEVGREPEARDHLDRAFVDRFVAVEDASYDDLRRMAQACREANFLTLR
jgi:phosphonate transport system substrate-binding protein